MATLEFNNGEHLIRIKSQHWIKYIFPAFVYLVLTVVSVLLFVLSGITVHHSMWLSHLAFVAALLLFLGTHHWFFLLLLSESSAHIIVTNHRVIMIRDRMLLDEEMNEYAFDKMKTVAAHKDGFWQTILRYGSLQFESGPDVRYVPHPNSVARDIEQAMGMS